MDIEQTTTEVCELDQSRRDEIAAATLDFINREFVAGGHAITGEEYALNVIRVGGAASRLAEERVGVEIETPF